MTNKKVKSDQSETNNDNIKFYSLKKILLEKAHYNVIIGERSNGKTYSVLELILNNYRDYHKQGAIIRRWSTDIEGKRAKTMFDNLVHNGVVKKLFKDEWTDILFRAGAWYLARYDDESDKWVYDMTPIAFAFALNTQEHDKSTSYPNITTVLFDEFLTRGLYLNDEFITFENTLSTIIRYRKDVTIFMCANTVNKYAPYFEEMGLNNVDKMKQGSIDVYTYGDSDLKVAVEYCASNKSGKKSDVYFAFNNPKLKMITTGEWEFDIYPHLLQKYTPKDIKLKYFIKFNNEILQCEIVKYNHKLFTYIHRKTTDLKYYKKDIIFDTEYSDNPLVFRRITNRRTPIVSFIYSFFIDERVFYQDNNTGEIVRNYLNWCQTA